MSLLEHPKAQELLADATLTASAVHRCREHLTQFLKRYLPHFYRKEQRELATVVIHGRLSGLERKTSEPIAIQAGRPRKPVQHFVGAGLWDDEAVMAELRRDVAEQLGDPDGVFILDGSGFPKKGTASCGVARQWCGRLGKVDNCQLGVFLAYAAAGGHALLDRRLYLPKDWAADAKRRQQCHVPDDIAFQEAWRIGLELIERSAQDVPCGWVAGDDEFGRATELRAQLRLRQKRYVLDIPSTTLVREVGAKAKAGGGRPGFERVADWAARQPAWRWKTLVLRGGEKGPRKVRALKRRVQTKEEDGHVGPVETVLAIRSLGDEPRTWYAVSNAGRQVPLAVLVGVHGLRHQVETCQPDYTSSRRWVGTRRIGYHRHDGVARAGRVVPATPGRPHRRKRMSDHSRRPTPPRA